MKPLRSTILSLLVCFYFFSKAQISEEQTREKLLEQGTKYYESNKFDSAVFYLEKSFAIAKEALDSNDEKLGTNAYHLGKAYQAKQRLNEAEEMLLPATNVFEKTKGKEDKVYCVCLNDLGALYDDMGKLNMSIDFYEQAILNAEKSVGKEHFYYGIYTSNLAQVYESLGEYEKALPLKIAVVTNIEKSLGKEHYYYGQSLNSLADL